MDFIKSYNDIGQWIIETEKSANHSYNLPIWYAKLHNLTENMSRGIDSVNKHRTIFIDSLYSIEERLKHDNLSIEIHLNIDEQKNIATIFEVADIYSLIQRVNRSIAIDAQYYYILEFRTEGTKDYIVFLKEYLNHIKTVLAEYYEYKNKKIKLFIPYGKKLDMALTSLSVEDYEKLVETLPEHTKSVESFYEKYIRSPEKLGYAFNEVTPERHEIRNSQMSD